MKEKKLGRAVLALPVRPEEVLLAMKLDGIGAGFLNGYGGGIKTGETEIEALIRETGEEAGVLTEPEDYEKCAIMAFTTRMTDGSEFTCRVHTYLLHRWKGEFRPSNEMGPPAWHRIDSLPLDMLMPADPFWLPQLLARRKFVGMAKYGPLQRELLEPVKLMYVGSFDHEYDSEN